jgi:hypothetical protein
MLVAKVLGPRLVVFRRLAKLTAKQGERLAKTMRIGMRETGRVKGLLVYCSDGPSIAPVFAVEAGGFKSKIVANRY